MTPVFLVGLARYRAFSALRKYGRAMTDDEIAAIFLQRGRPGDMGSPREWRLPCVEVAPELHDEFEAWAQRNGGERVHVPPGLHRPGLRSGRLTHNVSDVIPAQE